MLRKKRMGVNGRRPLNRPKNKNVRARSRMGAVEMSRYGMIEREGVVAGRGFEPLTFGL